MYLSVTVLFVRSVLCIAVAELALRALGLEPRSVRVNLHFGERGFAKPDLVLGWINRPGTVHSLEPGHVLMHFTEDNRRQEPSEPGVTPLSGVPVLVLGGSFVQGYGVRDYEPFAYLVDERFPALDILNYGTGGYGTYQSLLLMERYFEEEKRQAALVIYGMIGAHQQRNVASADWIKSLTTTDGLYYVPPHAALGPAGLERKDGTAVPLWPLETQSALVAAMHDALLIWRHRFDAVMAREITARIVLEMHQKARKAGADFLVVALYGVDHRTFGAITRAGEILVLDCQSHGYGNDPTLATGGSIGHPNGKLHAIWAECIAPWLEQRQDRFVPRITYGD